jgi:hypothetical protein
MHRRDVLALGLASLRRARSASRNLRAGPLSRAADQADDRSRRHSGVNDVVGRHWAERMKPLLGTIFVENQAGASG